MMRHLAVGLFLLALTAGAYRTAWSAAWVYEDRATLTSATTTTGWQRVITYATWRLTPTPRAAHLLNLMCHLVIGLLLAILARRLGLTALGMWVVVLLWLLHPLMVETVAYAKARSEQLVLIGVLLALIAASGRWWRPLGLIGISGGSLFALGSEPSGVVVFLLVPLMVWHRQHAQKAPSWASWWMPAGVAAALIVAGVVWYGGLWAVVNVDTEAGITSVSAVTWWQWGLAQSGAVWHWCRTVFWPAGVTPDLDVDHLSPLTQWLGITMMMAWAGLAVRYSRTRPLVTLALLWMLCMIGPRLIVQTPRSYLNAAQFAGAFMGLALLAGYGTEQWRQQWTRPF